MTEFLQLGERLWRWTAPHPEWTPETLVDDGWEQEVACALYAADGAAVLIDPLVPATEPARLWDALDRVADRPVHVVLTIHWHARSAQAVADRYEGTRVWAHEPARALVEERTVCTDTFRPGQTLPGGVVAIDAHRAWEILFWLPEQRALVVGDVLTGLGDGRLRVRDEWLGSVDAAAARRELRRELDLSIEHVLPAHGPPVLSGGRESVLQALE